MLQVGCSRTAVIITRHQEDVKKSRHKANGWLGSTLDPRVHSLLIFRSSWGRIVPLLR
jgi:hypothetical protein